MPVCQICKKIIRANTYVRLDDNFDNGERAHVKCFAKQFVESIEAKDMERSK